MKTITEAAATEIVAKAKAAGITDEEFHAATGWNFTNADNLTWKRLEDFEAKLASITARRAVSPTPRGWSNASRGSNDLVGDMLGRPSPARPGQCHYCGLSAATCDCN